MAAVWAASAPERLDPALLQMLEDPMNTPVFSVVSLWELVIKRSLNRPDFQTTRKPMLDWKDASDIESRRIFQLFQNLQDYHN